MKKTVKTQVIELFAHKSEYTIKELTNVLEVSRQTVHKVMDELVHEKFVLKVGSAPKVFYVLNVVNKSEIQNTDIVLIDSDREYIENNFMLIGPDGSRTEGVKAFMRWCQKTKQLPEKTAHEYIATLKRYNSIKESGLIHGNKKIKDTFSTVYLDDIYYADFYSIERFGKTKLGQMLLYAKKSQDKKMIKQIAELIKTRVEELIRTKAISAVGFIPPTEIRSVQFMTEIQKDLKLHLPVIELIKAKTEVIVPQKTISKLEDRIINADSTIFVSENRVFDTILLIDDAVGSGATLNQTAKKIKQLGIAKKVIGFSITGSANGFDIINEA
ncbi:MAG: competence protein ComFC [Candidatus Parcubacteria bacterium]|jgi:hypothetical protein